MKILLIKVVASSRQVLSEKFSWDTRKTLTVSNITPATLAIEATLKVSSNTVHLVYPDEHYTVQHNNSEKRVEARNPTRNSFTAAFSVTAFGSLPLFTIYCDNTDASHQTVGGEQ